MNVPLGSAGKCTFGPALVYFGAEGTTPLVDIGFITGNIEIELAREPLELFQGSPKSLQTQYAVKEEVNLKITALEWDLDTLSYALGDGTTSIVDDKEMMTFGGNMSFSNRAIRIVHQAADGGTIEFQAYKAQSAGNVPIVLNPEEWHTIELNFKCMDATTNFQGSATTTGNKKCNFTIQGLA